jgi:hypothetical protein
VLDKVAEQGKNFGLEADRLGPTPQTFIGKIKA